MSFTIRDARKTDMPQVLELIQELAVFEKEPDAVEVTVADLEKEGFGAHPLFRCFVAAQNDNLVGIALVYFRFSTWKGRTIHLEDLIVRKEERGKGVGSALYKRVMEYGKEQGVRRVEWAVLDWNQPAIAFYEKSGANVLRDWYVVQMDEVGLASFLP